MHLKSLAPLLLLFAAVTPPSLVAATDIAPRGLPSKYRPAGDVAERGGRRTTTDATEAVIAKSGTADAPVDGLDGKPHSGPGLYPESSGRRGSGEVGVSGGRASVDIKKPPPHTGEHEIVDVEEGDDSLVSPFLPLGEKREETYFFLLLFFILMILNDSYSTPLKTLAERTRWAPPHPRYLVARATRNTRSHRPTRSMTLPLKRSSTCSRWKRPRTLMASPSRSTLSFSRSS